MDTIKSSVPAHRSTHEPSECFACYRGVVYIGHLIEQDGEEVEVIEGVPCRRCAPVR